MKSLQYIPVGDEWAFRVRITRRRLAKLRIHPQGEKKQIALTLRRVFSEFSALTSPELLERLQAVELELGPYQEQDAIRLETSCREAGIEIAVLCYTEETELLVDTRGPAAWLIEDEEENRSVIREAKARGVRIEEN